MKKNTNLKKFDYNNIKYKVKLIIKLRKSNGFE